MPTRGVSWEVCVRVRPTWPIAWTLALGMHLSA